MLPKTSKSPILNGQLPACCSSMLITRQAVSLKGLRWDQTSSSQLLKKKIGQRSNKLQRSLDVEAILFICLYLQVYIVSRPQIWDWSHFRFKVMISRSNRKVSCKKIPISTIRRYRDEWSDSHRIQTYNLLIRSQMLYSVELASQTLE